MLEIDEFALFYGENLAPARRLATSILTWGGTADDAVHDAFIQARLEWNTLGERSPLGRRRWLLRAVRHRCYDQIARSERSNPRYGTYDEIGIHEAESFETSEIDRLLIEDLLDQLTPKAREVVECFLEGFSGPECAEALGITLTTYTTRFQRARIRLRKILGIDLENLGGDKLGF